MQKDTLRKLQELLHFYHQWITIYAFELHVHVRIQWKTHPKQVIHAFYFPKFWFATH